MKIEEIKKLPKEVILEEFLKTKEALERESEYRLQCRDYLMGVEPEYLTVEDCLEQLGYGRNGLDY